MKNSFIVKLVIFLILSCFFTAAVCFIFGTFSLEAEPLDKPSSQLTQKYSTVIIDAGHGGEDGGAVSDCGIVEKNINLDIALMLRDMLKMCGIDVIMTREDDRLLYDRSVDFHGRKKLLDLNARLNIAQNTANSIFVSIHMNSFTSKKYSGLQAWYSPNNDLSYTLANIIQNNTQKLLQPKNSRKIKSATSSIFILDNITSPAVLVECGFLSNTDEAAMLAEFDYRKQISFIIFCSIVEFLDLYN